MTRTARVSALTTVLALAALALGICTAARPAAADTPDWDALAKEGTVVAVTEDEDGAPRETKIWIVALDGGDYIRTGSTKWGDNLARKPELVLKTEAGAEHPLRVAFVEDPALKQRVEEAFRQKYGASDWFIAIFRMGDPRIMRLEPR
jgi:hypothetical protein